MSGLNFRKKLFTANDMLCSYCTAGEIRFIDIEKNYTKKSEIYS